MRYFPSACETSIAGAHIPLLPSPRFIPNSPNTQSLSYDLGATGLPVDVIVVEMRSIHPPDSDAQPPPPSLLHLLPRRGVSPSRGAHRPLQMLPACWFPDSKGCGPAAIRAEAGCC